MCAAGTVRSVFFAGLLELGFDIDSRQCASVRDTQWGSTRKKKLSVCQVK